MASYIDRLNKLLNSVEADIKNALLDMFGTITSEVILNELIEAIEEGDFDKVYVLLNITSASFNPVIAALEDAYKRSGDFAASQYPKRIKTPSGSIVFRFNDRNPRAEEWLRNRSSELVTRVSDDMREVIRTTMQKGMVDGANPRDTAVKLAGKYDSVAKKRVGGVIGLTPQQSAWVDSYRRNLEQLNPLYKSRELRDARFDKLVDNAIATRKPLTKDQIDGMVQRYVDRTLKYRADMISRTESIKSLATANYESLKQVMETGAVKEKHIKRKWATVLDGRARHDHVLMNGQMVGYEEPFTFPDKSKAMHPLDSSMGAPAKNLISCRCHEVHDIDWIGGALDVEG